MQNNFSGVVDIGINQTDRKLKAPTATSSCRQEPTGIPLWKRSLDLGLIFISAPITLLVGAVIALVIKVGSRGPVIFKQERVGYKGQTFTCFKFRTMHTGAEIGSHRGHTAHLIKSEAPMTKLDAKQDPRIIPFGTILRATGLDELPQLLNVLRGEMSIVGPRPCVQYEYEMYETWQKRRFDAVPGLTGLWQVSGKNRTTFNQMINLDIEYSERSSLGLDLKIIFKTIPALVVQCLDQRAQKRKARVATATVVAANPEATGASGAMKVAA
jgi:lipopolysaccharide/colanic/teichoic acid biosynthesis glycosyltransferase